MLDPEGKPAGSFDPVPRRGRGRQDGGL